MGCPPLRDVSHAGMVTGRQENIGRSRKFVLGVDDRGDRYRRRAVLFRIGGPQLNVIEESFTLQLHRTLAEAFLDFSVLEQRDDRLLSDFRSNLSMLRWKYTRCKEVRRVQSFLRLTDSWIDRFLVFTIRTLLKIFKPENFSTW